MRARYILRPVAIVAALLALAACASERPPDPRPVSAPPTSSSVEATRTASTCVEDPAAVIAAGQTEAAADAALDPALVTAVDAAVVATLPDTTAPGAVVGVRTRDGTWTAAYGAADSAGTPMAVGMRTRVASVTKPFTVTLIMQLDEDGLLSLDDHVADYLDGVPNGDRITLRQMADMTSGIGDYTADPAIADAYSAEPETAFTTDELIDAAIGMSPSFDPGERFEYSNSNAVMLGVIAEQVTGTDVEELFATRIFEPLGLDATVWPGESTELPEPYASGITGQRDGATADAPADATHWNPTWVFTAGELVSEADDLLAFGRALGTGAGILDPTSQQTRLTSFPGQSGYGLGFGCFDGWVGHVGDLPGYTTALFYDTTTDTTVVVQANSDIPSGDCAETPVRSDDPRTLPCLSPASRIFAAMSTALGHTFVPLPER